ncbi:cytochrome b/b6 domain-containing protein [Subtercola boreus]|uniref:cytochrome b/b6 domain-containing protein n=1 Tax=Subtercola boreus TaxID=120213 RepID=UPI00209C413D|nr:cytochrome b/b6 domain-containing protein [Subtercola boreus]
MARGEPWPPADDDALPAPTIDAMTGAPAATTAATTAAAAAATAAPVTALPPAEGSPAAARPAVGTPSGSHRRGLPRVAGAEPWPPASAGTGPTGPAVAASAVAAAAGSEAASAPAKPAPVPERPTTPERTAAPERDAARERPAAPAPTRAPNAARTAAPRARSPIIISTRAASAPSTSPAPSTSAAAPTPAGATTGIARLRHLPRPTQVVLGSLALLLVAAVAVLAVRGLTTYRVVQDFLQTYPGEYPLPDTVESGFPAWIGWQHFLNAFFIVLIIRSGWQVRTEKRPSAFWTARWAKTKRRISLNLWFHQALDVLWLLNGVVFVVLIFATGHWLRLVPSSWAVFPNAVSALIHYLTLEWPTDNGWVTYNSLQQLMYFIVVFVAAPLAALTGVRMSGIWPKRTTRLNAAYPIEVARAIHFPVMLFFVGFIIVHVALVFATGALRNLNHMYGSSDEVNWIGFGIFFASLVVMVATWIAARPLVIAPIASLFGKVTAR